MNSLMNYSEHPDAQLEGRKVLISELAELVATATAAA